LQQRFLCLGLIQNGSIPIDHLDTDKHPNHHDKEVDKNSEPVLVGDVFGYSS